MVFTRKDGDVHGLLLVSGKVSDCQDASGAILWYHQTCSPACKTANRRPKKIPQFCYANKKWEGVGDGDACLPLKNISVLICLDPPFGCQISSKKVCFLVVLGGLNFRRLRRIQVWIRIYFTWVWIKLDTYKKKTWPLESVFFNICLSGPSIDFFGGGQDFGSAVLRTSPCERQLTLTFSAGSTSCKKTAKQPHVLLVSTKETAPPKK